MIDYKFTKRMESYKDAKAFIENTQHARDDAIARLEASFADTLAAATESFDKAKREVIESFIALGGLPKELTGEKVDTKHIQIFLDFCECDNYAGWFKVEAVRIAPTRTTVMLIQGVKTVKKTTEIGWYEAGSNRMTWQVLYEDKPGYTTTVRIVPTIQL